MTDFETGEYTISATLYGAEAAAGSKTFWVTRRSDLPQLAGTVYQYGLSAAEIATLTARGRDGRGARPRPHSGRVHHPPRPEQHQRRSP